MYNFLFNCPRCGKDLTTYDAKNALQLPSITLFPQFLIQLYKFALRIFV